MNQDRRAIYQLLAQGRISPAQAERLIAAFGAERETAWVVAGCAAIVLFAQLHILAPAVLHIVREMVAGGLPALHHIVNSIAFLLGGLS